MSQAKSLVKEDAIEFIKSNKAELLNHFLSKDEYQFFPYPVSFFMAGSPGAGKTEFSKFFVGGLNQGFHDTKIVSLDTKIARLDADEVREFIPQYKGSNSREIQPAAALGVEYLFDIVKSTISTCC